MKFCLFKFHCASRRCFAFSQRLINIIYTSITPPRLSNPLLFQFWVPQPICWTIGLPSVHVGGLLGQWGFGLDATERGVAKGGGGKSFCRFHIFYLFKFEAFHIMQINLFTLKRKFFTFFLKQNPQNCPYPRAISKIWPILAGSAIHSPMGWIENNTEVQTRRWHLPPPPHTHTHTHNAYVHQSPNIAWEMGEGGRGRMLFF